MEMESSTINTFFGIEILYSWAFCLGQLNVAASEGTPIPAVFVLLLLCSRSGCPGARSLLLQDLLCYLFKFRAVERCVDVLPVIFYIQETSASLISPNEEFLRPVAVAPKVNNRL
jgi:hypothetical protein